MTQKIKALATKLNKIGFAHIFTTSVINKLLSLVTNMVIVRVMSKSDYGFYSYAYNIVTIVLIVSDLGTRMARFQYCCETNDHAERKAITRFLMRIGTISNVLFSVGTLYMQRFCRFRYPGESSHCRCCQECIYFNTFMIRPVTASESRRTIRGMLF